MSDVTELGLGAYQVNVLSKQNVHQLKHATQPHVWHRSRAHTSRSNGHGGSQKNSPRTARVFAPPGNACNACRIPVSSVSGISEPTLVRCRKRVPHGAVVRDPTRLVESWHQKINQKLLSSKIHEQRFHAHIELNTKLWSPGFLQMAARFIKIISSACSGFAHPVSRDFRVKGLQYDQVDKKARVCIGTSHKQRKQREGQQRTCSCAKK